MLATQLPASKAQLANELDGLNADDQPAGAPAPHLDASGQHAIPQATVAVAFAVLLLVLATTSQGAFAVSRWAPLTLFALALLIGALFARVDAALPASRAVRLALTGIWGLAALSMLSMLWAKSSGDAFIAADRMILYAAIVTLPFVLPISRRSLSAAGWAIAVGIGAIALYVLLRLLDNGASLFLAGRLNAPVNYRNATALLFALPVWPFIIAAATKSNRRAVRAASLSLATLCLGLSFLTQSRGILLGLGAGACVALTLGPDRVRRAWIAILVVGAVALASPWLLAPFHAFDGGRGYVSPHQITVAADALLVSSVAAFAVGMVLALFDNGLRAGSPQMRHARRAARLALAGGVAVAIFGAGVAIGNPVTYARSKWDEFRSLNSATPTTTRLLTTGGQRYDLWRVAIKEFESSPLVGVGADNYSFDYYVDRATNRNLDDPHSLLFSLLSEDGIVGIALFALFLGGLAGALRDGWSRLTPAQRRHAVAPAAVGAVLIGQSTVDWIWLIPGLTAIGLLALSLAAAQATAGAEREERLPGASDLDRRPATRRRTVRGAIAAGGLVLAAAAVTTLFLSDAYIQRARTLVDQPSSELGAAQVAAVLDPWSVTPHYLEASAYETMGNRPSALGQLRDALKLEPDNLANWGVLGDFEARGHDLDAARADYREALALDPLDTGLQQLARIGLTATRLSPHAARVRRPAA
ncbi:MAG: O-antigen ligase family protein [Solirubrobacteraceae bacterium]